ncbi:MAG TPA: FAD-dependent oxidoreductase [Hyphomicrobiaceae bacterium]|nr:FAD-dependent oxidoreductase [Hyphomicrobiaceae bacterium]
MRERQAIVIGAGVAGLAAAWWLRRIGWRVTVLERAADLRDAGYMIGLSGPGLEVARRMGLMPKLEAAACVINENVYRDTRGRELLRLRYREFLKDLPYVALRRTALVQALREVLDPSVAVQFSTHVTRVQGGPNGASVEVADGRTFEGDLIIGADGLRSYVRRQLFGPDGSYFKPLGYRFATYDLADRLNLGADFVSYTQPGHIVEYYTLSDHRIAALHVWCSKETGPVAADQRWPLIERESARSHPSVMQMIDLAKAEAAIPVLDDLTLVDMPEWRKGRVLLLGDAAHCLTLISGQGAGMAIASAGILAEELAKGGIEEALDRHRARLRPSIRRLQERSIKMGKLFVPATPMSFHMRNIMLRYMPRSWLGQYFQNAVKSEIIASQDVATSAT